MTLLYYVREYQPTNAVQHRLMYHVYNQAVPAEEIEHGYLSQEESVKIMLRDQPPQIESEHEEEYPRQDGGVVGGEKALVRKA